MGTQSVKAILSKKDRINFIRHLLNDVSAFELMLKNNLFETGIKRIGAEQEICIVNDKYTPAYNALEILDLLKEKQFTTELGLFNLELNLNPYVLKNDCFSQLEKSIESYLNILYKKAGSLDKTKPILTGILPSLRIKDLDFKYITPYKRYKTLNDAFKKIRGDDFKLHIQGVDELKISLDSILFEACNTSFQVHLQVDPDQAVDMYNWSQAIAGPVLSLMTNSPLLLGKELWSETRIALFEQSIDLRTKSHLLRGQKPRVSFGNDWIKNSILELFTDDISRYAPVVTSDFEENSLELLEQGIMPALKALNLHNGTLYKWNRVCYGVHNNSAHLRIENRYIPSGPSIKDEVANAMFWVGIMLGMPNEYKNIWKKMSFKEAKGNFTNAARTGIDSYFFWNGKEISAKKLATKILLPMAETGLINNGVNKNDIDKYLNIIRQRILKNTTGSKWIIRNKRILQRKFSQFETNILLTKKIHQFQKQNIPVDQWENFNITEKKLKDARNKVYKIMSRELFIVAPDDLLELISKIMEWKKIHHIPVINNENKILGIVAKNSIDKIDFSVEKNSEITAYDIMNKNFITTNPDTLVDHLKILMKKENQTAAAVIYQDELVGIVTVNDFIKPSAKW